MATIEQVETLRRLVAEADDSTYSDADLSALIDGSASLNGAAASIWTQKAAAASAFVNVSESGSSRSLGDLQGNALKMATQFATAAEADQTTSPGIRIRRITRA